MKRSIIIRIFILSALVLTVVVALTQPSSEEQQAKRIPKIGYVKLSLLLDNYEGIKAMNVEYKKDYNAYMSQLQDLEKIIADMKAKKAPINDIKAKEQELAKKQKDYEKALQDKYQPILNKIVAQVDDIIKVYGKSKGYDYILKDASVLYADPMNDLTSDILRYANLQYGQKGE